jgi:hypothetical protein
MAKPRQPSYSDRLPFAGIQPVLSVVRAVCSRFVGQLPGAATARPCDGPIHSEEFRAAVYQLQEFTGDAEHHTVHGKLSE